MTLKTSTPPKDAKASLLHFKGRSIVVPFICVTICFALWGFANDITNPMVKAFSKIFSISTTEGALVQFAFYGGYFVMALPAAMVIRRFNFKTGIIVGLALYATGALLFYPSVQSGAYVPFLLSYFIMTCGLSFLETGANPYILQMGDPRTATRRLNLAQSFNPIGSLLGMFVAMYGIQANLSPLTTAERNTLDPATYEAIKNHDLNILATPYIYIGFVLIALIILLLIIKLPVTELDRSAISRSDSPGTSFRRLWRNKAYRNGVIAQFFYVGAQIMVWTFIIQYGTRLFVSDYGMAEHDAEILSMKYNIAAMILYCSFRFINTFLLRYVRPTKLLGIYALLASIFTIVAIVSTTILGLVSIVLISICMSLMFPTIYGISLQTVGRDTKFGAAGLIMAILGGSVLPPLQAMIIDNGPIAGHPGENLSFILPLLSFIVVLRYAYNHEKKA